MGFENNVSSDFDLRSSIVKSVFDCHLSSMVYVLIFHWHMGDFKNNASISLINVYRLSKADLLLKLILRYVIYVFLASCQVALH